jgi:hypothetical protein
MRRLIIILGALFFGASSSLFAQGSASFTAADGTALASYANGGDLTFTKSTYAGYTSGGAQIDANRVRSDTANEVLFYSSSAPANANYSASAKIRCVSALSSSVMGPGVRWSTTNKIGLVCYYSVSSKCWTILQRNTSSDYSTKATFAEMVALVPGDERLVTIGCADTVVWAEIRLVDGTLLGRMTGTTQVTTAGRPGIYASGAATTSTGFHLDDFSDTASSASAVVITTPTPYRVYQRNGSSQASIAVTGRYAGSPTTVEARWSGRPWVVPRLQAVRFPAR